MIGSVCSGRFGILTLPLVCVAGLTLCAFVGILRLVYIHTYVYSTCYIYYAEIHYFLHILHQNSKKSECNPERLSIAQVQRIVEGK